MILLCLEVVRFLRSLNATLTTYLEGNSQRKSRRTKNWRSSIKIEFILFFIELWSIEFDISIGIITVSFQSQVSILFITSNKQLEENKKL